MEKIIKKIEIDNKLLVNFPEGKNIFFDIETTGFSRVYNRVYLIGMLYYSSNKKSWIIEQAFISNPNMEKELVSYFNDKISEFDNLISFNGDSFDIPFVKAKLEKYGISHNFNKIASYDIYRRIRAYKYILPLENFKLKSLEEFLGIYREDIYSGKDCIDFYNNYVRTKDIDLKEKLLLHNYEDLYYLKDVLAINSYIDKKTKFSLKNVEFELREINFKKNELNLHIDSNKPLNIFYFKNQIEIKNIDSYSFFFKINLKEGYLSEDQKDIYSFIEINEGILLLAKNREPFLEKVLSFVKLYLSKLI